MKALSVLYMKIGGKNGEHDGLFHRGMDATPRGGLCPLLRFPEALLSVNSPKSSRIWSSDRVSETMKTEEVESA